MSAYVLSMLAASLVVAVAELLAPKGEGGRMADSVRMIAGLFLLVALLHPLQEGIRILQEAAEGDLSLHLEDVIPDVGEEDYGEAFHASLATISKGEAEAWVISVLDTVFGISPSSCSVEVLCEADASRVTLLEVRISLHGTSVFEDPHPIEAYVTAHLQCPCFVTVHV